METIRYSKNNLDFSQEIRTRVKEYFTENNIQQYGNRQIIVKTIFMAVLYFVPYILMTTGIVSGAIWVLLSYFIMGLGMAGLGMGTMHDANHGSFSRSKKTNKFFSMSLYLLGGFPSNWRFQHNTLHHGYTNIEGHDGDIAPVAILKFSPHQPHKAIHRYQYLYAWFFYSLMTISWITMNDFKKIIRYKKMGANLNSKKPFSALFSELILSKILYYGIFLFVPMFVLPIAWYWFVAGFILMHLTGGIILSTIFQTAHVVPTSNYPLPDENNEISNNWAVHQLYTTSNFSPNSRIFSWFIGGLNYQVIHHLFPQVSHIHYKNIAPIVQAAAEKYGLPYYVNRNFFAAVYEHTKMLKQLGRKTIEKEIEFNSSLSQASGM
ncbi:MAG: acyl-CoA desaturase [Bacteroidales bacterium]|nr:acyl-CoA desaturase [Bacteroidales bacterium]